MVNQVENKIVGIPVEQNQHEFIIGIFEIRQILKFTRYTERLIVGFKEDNLPDYNPHIQRKVERQRVEEIANFLIDNPEAVFPTNIVLSIPIQAIDKQYRNGDRIEIYLKDVVLNEMQKDVETSDTYITIIDGQHRIKGIERAIEVLNEKIRSLQRVGTDGSSDLRKKLDDYRQRYNDLLSFQLVVSFFIDKTLEFQAMIFSTINRTQKRVSQNLVYSLFGLTTDDSPQKSALQITMALNAHPNSPFFKRVKLYGGSYESRQSPPLSQATMVKSILDLISYGRDAEKDRFKKRRELLTPSSKPDLCLPFRPYYATDNDSIISDIIFYFFSAVEDVFIDESGDSFWKFSPDTTKPSNILQTTVGYLALLNILEDLLCKKEIKELKKKDEYNDKLSKARGVAFGDQNKFPFSNLGKNILYLTLSLKIHPPLNDSDKRVIKLSELNRRLEVQ